jgi:hypothetical protein
MSKITLRTVLKFTLGFTFLALLSVPALAQTTHSVWSDKPLYLTDGATGKQYKAFVKGDAAFAWTQATIRAYAHAVGVVSPGLTYDFMLVKTTSSDATTISGLFDIKRNGVLVCHNCVGKAYGLDQAAGGVNYFKIYVGTPAAYAEKWHYSGYLTNRFDF